MTHRLLPFVPGSAHSLPALLNSIRHGVFSRIGTSSRHAAADPGQGSPLPEA